MSSSHGEKQVQAAVGSDKTGSIFFEAMQTEKRGESQGGRNIYTANKTKWLEMQRRNECSEHHGLEAIV